MRKIELVKRSDGLFCPAYNSDHELSKKVKDGASITAALSFPRSYQFNKKFFALINYTFHHMHQELQERYRSPELLRYDLIRLAGYEEVYQDVHGNVHTRPRSIRFESMDEEEFSKLYSAVLDQVVKWFLPLIDPGDLVNFM